MRQLRLLPLLAVLAAGLTACPGPDLSPDASTPLPDAGTDVVPDAGSLPDAGEPDAGPPPDAGTQTPDAGEPTDLGAPLAQPLCVDVEDATLEGQTRTYAGSPETVRGTVLLGPDGLGVVRVPFTLEQDTSFRVWVRVRAVTPTSSALSASLDAKDTTPAATWDIPLTPVLRWQRVTRRETGTTLAPGDTTWPRTVAAGAHQLVLAGLEPDVELDAVCLMAPGQEPAERFAVQPERAITVRLSDFGAVGDGAADDTSALQAALDALTPGGALYIPPGRYRYTRRLDLKASDATVMGEGSSSVLFADFAADTPASQFNTFNMEGQYETGTVPLTKDAPQLSRTVTVAATADGPFAVGDLVQVRSDDWGPTAPNNVGQFFRNRAAFARITAVETRGTDRILTLDRPLLSIFMTATNSKVELFRPLRNVVLTRLAFEGTNKATPTDNADLNLVGAKRCERCFFTELTLRYARKAALDLYLTMDTQVVGVQVSDTTDTGGDGHGYGVTFSRSQGGVLRKSLFSRVLRHGVPISWGSRETFVFDNRFDRSIPHTNNIASIDLHGQDDYSNLVERNFITGGQPGIIVGGGGTSHGNDGPWNVVRGNRLEDTNTGISVYKQTYNTVIDGNIVLRPNNPGIVLDTGSDSTHVWHNDIETYLGSGVSVDSCNKVEVLYNTFANGTGPAVRLFNSVDYVVQYNWLNGQTIQHPGTGTASPNY